jgi:hypothetical protein
MGKEMRPTIGKATPDKVQIYYGHITQISSDMTGSESCQYYWHTIDVSIRTDMPTSIVDLTWYDQIPTCEAIETVKATYRTIIEYVKKQGYWCGEGYLFKKNSASEGIPLPVVPELVIQQQHLIDDLFLLSIPKWRVIGVNFLFIHSLSQKHLIWSKNKLSYYVFIPEEKAILTYYIHCLKRCSNVFSPFEHFHSSFL